MDANFSTDEEIIDAFIKSEDIAITTNSQGNVYPSYHSEIKRIAKTSMNNFSDDQIISTFYHLMNLRNLDTIKKKNYTHFKKAFALLLPRIYTELNFCFFPTASFVLFNGIDPILDDINKMDNIAFEDFSFISKFIRKCNSYTHYDSLFTKGAQINAFLENSTLLSNISNNLQHYCISAHFFPDQIFMGIMVALLHAKDKNLKKILYTINNSELNDNVAEWIKILYEAFQNTTDNKKLLVDFTNKHTITSKE